ncbi:MAG: twin-arginine translocase TatA/TatE family subunit [Anaerolineales bacterium]|nr:twin-arginine translocase TatA/TatE family subunit [Anaerolineales bacterium]
MNLGPTELIIILAIIILIFGVGRLSRIGGELGRGIREFRTGLRGNDEEAEAPANEAPTEEEVP